MQAFQERRTRQLQVGPVDQALRSELASNAL